MKTVIFACVHGAGRSQMAAAFFNKYKKNEDMMAFAAGSKPAARVHPEVVTVMEEVGIDLSDTKPTALTFELAQSANILVTMGCGENCPVVPGLQVIDWMLPDPKDQELEHIRQIRNRIETLVKDLIQKNFD